MKFIRRLKKQNTIQNNQLPSTSNIGESSTLPTPEHTTHTNSEGETVSMITPTTQAVENPSIFPSPISPNVRVAEPEGDKELMKVRAFWLLDLFPNELIIREKSLHVIYRNFLMTNVETMLVKDISIVQVNHGFLFSSLIISYRIPHEDLQIAKLPTDQAFKAKALLDKLMIVKQESPDNRVELLEENSNPSLG